MKHERVLRRLHHLYFYLHADVFVSSCWLEIVLKSKTVFMYLCIRWNAYSDPLWNCLYVMRGALRFVRRHWKQQSFDGGDEISGIFQRIGLHRLWKFYSLGKRHLLESKGGLFQCCSRNMGGKESREAKEMILTARLWAEALTFWVEWNWVDTKVWLQCIALSGDQLFKVWGSNILDIDRVVSVFMLSPVDKKILSGKK